jgi:hypothetical protein
MILQSVGPPSDQLRHTGDSLPRDRAVMYSWLSLHVVLMLGMCAATHSHLTPSFVVMWSLIMHRDKWGLGVAAT